MKALQIMSPERNSAELLVSVTPSIEIQNDLFTDHVSENEKRSTSNNSNMSENITAPYNTTNKQNKDLKNI